MCFREKIRLRKHWKIRPRPAVLVDLEVVDSEKAGVVQERVMNKLRSFNGFFFIYLVL